MEVAGMPKHSSTNKHASLKRSWRQGCVLTAMLAGVLVLGGGSAMAAEPAAPATGPAVTPAAVQQSQNAPFLFSYTFNGHLKLGGGHFTVGGTVYVAVKFNDGTVKFAKQVVAQPHPITPGGAIYVETPIAAPCAPGNNGYAQAYDYATQRWSPRLPVAICQPI
jgi:hypothetical protein